MPRGHSAFRALGALQRTSRPSLYYLTAATVFGAGLFVTIGTADSLAGTKGVLLSATATAYMVFLIAQAAKSWPKSPAKPARPNNQIASILEPSGWYRDWYFNLRLAEEILRADRYHLSLGLIRIQFRPSWENFFEERVAFHTYLRDLVGQKIRRTDIPGMLGHLDYAICLPMEEEGGVLRAVERLSLELREYSGHVGYAVFPLDGHAGPDLLARAKDRIVAATEIVPTESPF